MKRLSTYTFLIILLWGACSLQAQNANEGRYNLAVYATGLQDGQDISASIKMIAQNTASTNLTGEGNYRLIERSSEFLKQIEVEQKFQQSGDVADNQIAELGASYGAQKICVISITIDGDYLYVAARIVDVATKTSFESGEAENTSYSGVAQIRPTVVKAINQILGVSSTTPAVNRPATSIGTSGDKSFTVNGVTFKMIFVRGGTFQMGSYSGADNEKPVHSVTVSDFYMGEFEVTQALWLEVMGTTVYQQRDKEDASYPMRGVGEDYPIYFVSHTEAEEFCGRLNQRLRSKLPDGYVFALPTEAEWEYAAKGGNKSNAYTYSGSNYLWDVGWYTDNSSSSTHVVGAKMANVLGLYDMSGNVYEWCSDWYGSYSGSSQVDPTGPSSGSNRVLRGGGSSFNASHCRVTNRTFNHPDYRRYYGFRLALVRR